MTKQTHSPLPWKAYGKGHELCGPNLVDSIKDAKGKIVQSASIDYESEGISKPEDLEYLLRAVNSHYELVEACEALMNTFILSFDGLNAEHVKVWDQTKQALKKAKGE